MPTQATPRVPHSLFCPIYQKRSSSYLALGTFSTVELSSAPCLTQDEAPSAPVLLKMRRLRRLKLRRKRESARPTRHAHRRRGGKRSQPPPMPSIPSAPGRRGASPCG